MTHDLFRGVTIGVATAQGSPNPMVTTLQPRSVQLG